MRQNELTVKKKGELGTQKFVNGHLSGSGLARNLRLCLKVMYQYPGNFNNNPTLISADHVLSTATP